MYALSKRYKWAASSPVACAPFHSKAMRHQVGAAKARRQQRARFSLSATRATTEVGPAAYSLFTSELQSKSGPTGQVMPSCRGWTRSEKLRATLSWQFLQHWQHLAQASLRQTLHRFPKFGSTLHLGQLLVLCLHRHHREVRSQPGSAQR